MNGILKTTKDVQRAIERSLKKNPKDQRRYFVAYLADGTKRMEHDCRWADVPLREIVTLELRMGAKTFRIESKNCPGFVEFIHFKTALRRVRGTPGVPDKTTSRCIGWTNGTHEFVIRVDEKTCQRSDPESCLLRQGHLHPQSKLLKKPSNIVIPNPVITVAGGDNGKAKVH